MAEKPNTVEDARLIRTVTFLGTVEHFVNVMRYFAGLHPAGYVSANDEVLFTRVPTVYNHPTRTFFAWQVSVERLPTGEPARSSQGAGIKAYELPSGTTLVEFWDGIDLHRPRAAALYIGDSFREFCDDLIKEMRKLTSIGKRTNDGEEDKQTKEALKEALTKRDRQIQPSLPKYVPKTLGTIKRWRKVYNVWRDMYDSYLDDRDEKPTYNDLGTAIDYQLGFTYGIRTLGNIVRAGKGGYLD